MREIRQSTPITVSIGPFVDEIDGDTEETALVITQADVLLSKNGAAAAQKSESSNSPHDQKGHYLVTLDVDDIDTLGDLKLICSMPGALPVWEHFMVVSRDYYDAKYGTSQMPATTQGTGEYTMDYYVFTNETAETGPIPGVYVWVTSDSVGQNKVAAGTTDANGKVTFWLDPGVYYLWRSKSGYRFTNPDIENFLVDQVPEDPPESPAGPGSTQYSYYVYTDAILETGPIEGVRVLVSTTPAAENYIASGTTDINGRVLLWLDPGTYYLWLSKAGYEFSNPDVETFA